MNIYQSTLVFDNDKEITLYCGDNLQKAKFILEEGLISHPTYIKMGEEIEERIKYKRIDIWLDGEHIGVNILYNLNDYN